MDMLRRAFQLGQQDTGRRYALPCWPEVLDLVELMAEPDPSWSERHDALRALVNRLRRLGHLDAAKATAKVQRTLVEHWRNAELRAREVGEKLRQSQPVGRRTWPIAVTADRRSPRGTRAGS